MEKKCKNCGKYFDVGEFSEEYCPYCGTVLDKKDRDEIRNREYFWKRYGLGIIVGSIILITLVFIIIARLST